MSSDTEVVAPPETEYDARIVLVSILWYRAKKGGWPKRRDVAHRQSWRGPEARKAAESYLVNRGYMDIDEDTTCQPTRAGFAWLEPPSLKPSTEPDRFDVPDEDENDDLLQVYLWIENHLARTGEWPMLLNGRQSGVRRRLGADRYRLAIKKLVDSGWLVRISIKSSTENTTDTRYVSLRWCPWLAGLDGKLYYA